MVINHDAGILPKIVNTIDYTFTCVRIKHASSLDASEMDQYYSRMHTLIPRFIHTANSTSEHR